VIKRRLLVSINAAPVFHGATEISDCPARQRHKTDTISDVMRIPGACSNYKEQSLSALQM